MMKKTHRKPDSSHERVIFSLPKTLVAELGRYAGLVRGGNKSGFVADAIQAYITRLRKLGHTRKLRQAYAAAAGESLAIAREWDALSDEVWAKLEERED
jgi:metal-responsive CopG/Arc/MetJ family transcriptional regulator